jgi:hypothetical protein
MIQLELKNHPVWHDLTEILERLDSDALIREHLQECDYKVCGYWDERDEYYEEIVLPRSLESVLVSSSIGVTRAERSLKLAFVLEATGDALDQSDGFDRSVENLQKIGELVLVYNENLEFVDESWVLEVGSPLLRVKR